MSDTVVLNGVPGTSDRRRSVQLEGGKKGRRAHHTGLEVEDVRPVIWLYEQGLILMFEVQLLLGVRLH